MKHFIRSPNGFGCIRKYKGNRYRPYAFIVSINGKQKTLAYFTNYKDANIYRAKYIANHKELADVKEVDIKNKFYKSADNAKDLNCIGKNESKNKTFKEVYEEWFPKHVERNNVADSTITGYKNSFRHCESIQHVEIDKIKFNDLQSILDNLDALNLSYSTKKKVRNLMSLVFQYARAMDYINKDYVGLLHIGKNKKIRPHKPFIESEIAEIWKHQYEKFFDNILILLYTGMRVGELLNIKKAEVNLQERYLSITKSKTAAGIRLVPINSKIFPFIVRKMRSEGEYLINKNGIKFSYSSFCSCWDKCMKLLQLQHTTHDCRHTVASRLNTANANEIAIRRILGHAQQNVTEGYTHKTIDELLSVIELLK